jgi:hypothetical protein
MFQTCPSISALVTLGDPPVRLHKNPCIHGMFVPIWGQDFRTGLGAEHLARLGVFRSTIPRHFPWASPLFGTTRNWIWLGTSMYVRHEALKEAFIIRMSQTVNQGCRPKYGRLSSGNHQVAIWHHVFMATQAILPKLTSPAGSLALPLHLQTSFTSRPTSSPNKHLHFKQHTHTSFNTATSFRSIPWITPYKTYPRNPRTLEFMSIENLKTFGESSPPYLP